MSWWAVMNIPRYPTFLSTEAHLSISKKCGGNVSHLSRTDRIYRAMWRPTVQSAGTEKAFLLRTGCPANKLERGAHGLSGKNRSPFTKERASAQGQGKQHHWMSTQSDTKPLLRRLFPLPFTLLKGPSLPPPFRLFTDLSLCPMEHLKRTRDLWTRQLFANTSGRTGRSA